MISRAVGRVAGIVATDLRYAASPATSALGKPTSTNGQGPPPCGINATGIRMLLNILQTRGSGAAAFNLVQQPVGEVQFRRLEAVYLILFDRDRDPISLRLEVTRLCLHS